MKTMSLEDFGARLTELFPRLMKSVSEYEHAYVAQGVITCPQVWALDCLRQAGELPMKDLAVAMGLKVSSATGLVDRMIRHSLVKRTRSEEDRRVVRVSITPKGRRILSEIVEKKKEGLAKMFSPLSAAERAQYLSLIEKLVQRLHGKDGK